MQAVALGVGSFLIQIFYFKILFIGIFVYSIIFFYSLVPPKTSSIESSYHTIQNTVVYFPIIGIISIFLSWIAWSCWMSSAERQVQRIRFVNICKKVKATVAEFVSK